MCLSNPSGALLFVFSVSFFFIVSIHLCSTSGVPQTFASTRWSGRVTGVTTERGDIAAEYVVNCAGMWAREFGALAGVNVPNQVPSLDRPVRIGTLALLGRHPYCPSE